MTGRKVTSSTLALLRKEEGLRLNAYRDTGGVATIGYGATWYDKWANRVKMGDVLTKEKAEYWLKYHANYFEKQVNKYIKVPLTQNQFDVLVSFCYNIGEVAFAKSSVVAKVNANPKDFAGVKSSLLLYENKNRRLAEAILYATKDSPIIMGIITTILLFFLYVNF